MSRIQASSLLLVFALAVPSTARADFLWLEPWQTTREGNAGFYSGTDGQAEASAFASLPPGIVRLGDDDISRVHFSRRFEITPDTPLLSVRLDAEFEGFATRYPLTVIDVQTFLFINSGTAYIYYSHFPPGAFDDPGYFHDGPDSVTYLLQPGTYVVSGYTAAIAYARFDSLGGHTSGMGRLRFSVTPRSVPEPASLVLVGIGGAAWCVGRARKRAANEGGSGAS